ncbi:MAG: DNA polymerase III subunit delta [Eubacteriales bacterium]
MTVSQLKSALQKGSPSGCFLFFGEEDYLLRHYRGQLRRAILKDEALTPFNHLVFEGDQPDLAPVTEALRGLPLLAEQKLVEWQRVDFDRMKEAELEQVESLCRVQAECPYACLLLVAHPQGLDPGSPRRPSARLTRLSKTFQTVHFEHSTDSQLHAWLARHFERAGVTAAADVVPLLVAYCGRSMQTLADEVNKLLGYAHANRLSRLSAAEVRFVCSPTMESDTFGLTNALLEGDAAQAYLHLQDLRNRRVDPTLVMGQIGRLYGDLCVLSTLLDEGADPAALADTLRMHSYKVSLYSKAARKAGTARLRACLYLISEADLQAKSRSGDPYRALEMLLAHLL